MQHKTKIGIALGGGVAKGWAHIGIMHALRDAGIKPDVIAGTSIGAVVGGCWAADKLTDLEAFARSLTKRKMFSLMDLSLTGSGLIGGSKLSALLNSHMPDVQIEDLETPFCCMATELQTGHEIWLSSGSLTESIRASYAMPGIFQPVKISGKWMVDGALVNPVPVSVCRAMGANYVIAINLSSDTLGRGSVMPNLLNDQLTPEDTQELSADTKNKGAISLLRRQMVGGKNGPPGISSVMIQSFSIIQDRISRSRLAGDPPDMLVTPELGDIGQFEFYRAAEAIDAGYKAGEKIARRLGIVSDDKSTLRSAV